MLFRVDEARFHRRGDERFEIAASELGIRILARDDLALLRDAQSAGHAAGRLREDRLVRRPAAAPDRAAAPVEEPQLDAVRRERVDQPHLGAIQRPVRGQIAAVLVAVGVAEHHFLPVVAAGDERRYGRLRERVAHDRAAAREVVDRLEQRHDVDARARSPRSSPASLSSTATSSRSETESHLLIT